MRRMTSTRAFGPKETARSSNGSLFSLYWEHAASDVLVLLDCCFAASADLTSVNGAVEVLAACGREVGTIGIFGRSFTSRLTEVLYK